MSVFRPMKVQNSSLVLVVKFPSSTPLYTDNRNYCLGQLELVGDDPMNVQG
jgi:hypothetical protein